MRLHHLIQLTTKEKTGIYRAEFNLSVNKKILGSYYLAFSNDISGKTNKEIESDLINIDYPLEKTFENEMNYLQLLIEKSIENMK